ncbi:MAG: radical SAM protein [Pseudonocardiaceae bacterium]
MSSAEPVSWRPFRSRVGSHVLVLRGSQILDLPETLDLAALDPEALAPYLRHGAGLGLSAVPSVAPQSISLNVTSACNLGCTYCYADRGRFGGAQAGTMSVSTAQRAVDALLAGCERQALATVGFLGGEPFLHRSLVHQLVAYTSARADELDQPVGFSVTTNGTRLDPGDLDLLRSHRFAVTVSIDGGRVTHDRLRRNLLGGGSWDDVVAAVAPLLARPGLAAVSARATVCRDDLDLTGRYDALVGVGFTSVGFAPVRLGWGALRDEDWSPWTAASVALGERELARIRAGGDTAFSNLRTALHQLHAGWSAPYPCGAGGGYASVSTTGQWYACHRAIGDQDYALGDAQRPVDPDRQRRFLEVRHVEQVEPCRQCWARYLCSGGCHQEATARTDASCDAIRGWLEFCLDAYCAVSSERLDWFALPPAPTPTEAGRN